MLTVKAKDTQIAVEILADAALVADQMTDENLAEALLKAQKALQELKEAERILREEALSRMNASAATMMTTDTFEIHKKTRTDRKFDTAVLNNLANILPADTFAATFEDKREWKWAELKQVAKTNASAAALIAEGTKEKENLAGVEVKPRR